MFYKKNQSLNDSYTKENNSCVLNLCYNIFGKWCGINIFRYCSGLSVWIVHFDYVMRQISFEINSNIRL